MTLKDIRTEINEFYLESKNREYPNSIILTKEQYKTFIRELFKVPSDLDVPEGIIIQSIEGLRVVLTEQIDTPRIVKV
jgi:hypothetical protein